MSANGVTIIKRKKVVAGGGHHGGAWKVAYADFVTAMMAFFLMMWLLNATSEAQRQGLADYFSPTIAISKTSSGGDGALAGDDVLSEDTLTKSGVGATDIRHDQSDRAAGRTGSDPDTSALDDNAAFEEVLSTLEAALQGRAGESMVSDDILRHVVTRVTDEGLVVDLFDLPGAPLFNPSTADPTALMRDLTAIVGDVFAMTPNRIAVNGHVTSVPVVVRENRNWDLSAARAQSVRTLVERPGFGDERIARVAGFADRKPAEPATMDTRNNRIELILLREPGRLPG